MIELIILAIYLWRIGDVAHSKGRGRWRFRLIGLLVLVPAWILGTITRLIIVMFSIANNPESPPSVIALVSGTVCFYGAFIIAGFLYWKKVNSLAALENAPGDAYLFITFNCPECKSTIRFRRDYADTQERCPNCNKHVMVPEQSQITDITNKNITIEAAQPAPPAGRGEAPRP